MAAIFASAGNQIKNFWSGISVSQRLFIGALSTLTIAVFIGLIVWMSQAEFSPLYTNLAPEDANRVVKSLEAQKVPFKIEQNGTVILVPADKVHALRISMAGDNVITGKGVGFELFDDIPMGLPEGIMKQNIRRALEGELARTISEFPSVENARIHLVIPNRSLFIEEQQRTSASVLLTLRGGKSLENKEVQAILNLVTMSVEGLDKSRVSIADTNGKVLFQPDDEGSLDGLTRTQFDHKNIAQLHIERKLEEMLMPVVGAGRVIVKVNADLDFSQKTIRRELFDPEKQVVRSEMRSEESNQGRASIDAAGVPDPNFRGDGPGGNRSDQTATRETRTTNYEINKEEQSIVSQFGGINRLTVSVIVDGTYTKGEDGAQVYVPRTAEELKEITESVKTAIGYDSARGDLIKVSNMSFGGVEIEPVKNTAAIIADYALRFGKPMLNAFLVFLFLIMIVRPVVLALIRPKVEGRLLEGLEGLPMSEERLALVDDDDEAVAATAMLEKIEDIKAHALQLSEQNIDQAIGIIKSWLKEPVKDAKGAVPAKAA